MILYPRTLSPGQLHRNISGRTVEYVAKTDRVLLIRFTDGFEVRLAWVDVNGEPLKGEPAIVFAGLNVHAKSAGGLGIFRGGTR